MKWIKSPNFCIFMYIWWFLKFLVILLQKAYQAKFYQQNSQHFYKTAHCSHHCPLRHNDHQWGIGIPGYSDLGSKLEQSHHLPRTLLPGDYRQPIEFPTGVPIFNYSIILTSLSQDSPNTLAELRDQRVIVNNTRMTFLGDHKIILPNTFFIRRLSYF